MKNKIGAVRLSLAAADLNPSELHSFFRWVESCGADQAVDTIMELRFLSEQSARSVRRVLGATSSSKIDERSRHADKDEILRIEQILMAQSGLNKSKLTALFSQELIGRGISRSSIPDPSKIAFRRWLEKLAQRIPIGELLRAASKLRNELAHGSRIDWPLRRDPTST
jgi:hypothetical protein